MGVEVGVGAIVGVGEDPGVVTNAGEGLGDALGAGPHAATRIEARMSVRSRGVRVPAGVMLPTMPHRAVIPTSPEGTGPPRTDPERPSGRFGMPHIITRPPSTARTWPVM